MSIFSGPYAWLARGVLYLVAAAAIAAGGAYLMHRHEQPIIDGLNQQVGGLKADLKVASASVTALEAAIAKQNAAAAAEAADGQKRLAEAQAALAAAQKTLADLRRQKAAADAYVRPAGMDACTAAQTIIDGDNNAQ